VWSTGRIYAFDTAVTHATAYAGWSIVSHAAIVRTVLLAVHMERITTV
jgi:hypothetical protein